MSDDGGRWRERTLQKLEQYLWKTTLPRFQMTIIVIVTGAVGFLVSFGLLKVGLDAMWLRYPLAVLAAYAVFLALLRLWAEIQRARLREVELDVPAESEPRGALQRERGYALDWLDIPWETGIDLDPEGCALLAIPLLALAAVIIACFSVIAAAPALLAEVLLDAIVVAALYRRLRGLQRQHWLAGAVKRTWIPALLIAALLGVGGFIAQTVSPDVKSVGDIWRLLRKDEKQGAW